jgi:hypothetical protein
VGEIGVGEAFMTMSVKHWQRAPGEVVPHHFNAVTIVSTFALIMPK